MPVAQDIRQRIPQPTTTQLEAAFPWLLALLAVGYIAFHWSDPVTLAPDSGGYLRFSEHRTAGYPLFLRAVETLFGTTDAAAESAARDRGDRRSPSWAGASIAPFGPHSSRWRRSSR